MRGDVLGRINVAGELRSAVRGDGLDIDYQPIVDLATGQVVAMEALARWTDASGERVPPDVFIPVAEETGLIGELGAVILRGAVRRAVSWQRVGAVGVRVNASAHELRSHTYVDQVLSTLEQEGLDPQLLGLEITESIFVDDDKTTQDTLSRLRDAGVSLLIDDFGTGYSSLSYLQRFPVVDVLKIDRSFLGEGTRGEAVVQAVVGLGGRVRPPGLRRGGRDPRAAPPGHRARVRLRPGLPARAPGAGRPDRRAAGDLGGPAARPRYISTVTLAG